MRPDFPHPDSRFPVQVPGFGALVGGGLFKGGIYILTGQPGSGKTIFANQVSFGHAARGGRVVYVTLLGETHARMLGQMRTLGFFDESVVGQGIVYVNGFSTVEQEGVEGLLKLLRQVVREQNADFLVVDGMVTVGTLARSDLDYKKFINELQTWVGVVGCTVLLLTSATAGETTVRPEHTMVDGLFEMTQQRVDVRSTRQFTVSKFRGSAVREGAHTYLLSQDGVRIYPRLEATASAHREVRASDGKRSTGIKKLDTLLGGGLAEGSTTLVLGSSGCGKTVLGLHFLTEGARLGEPGYYFGLFENPPLLVAKGDRLGMELGGHVEAGRIHLDWQLAAERLLDPMGERILEVVRAKKIKRLVIDGLPGFKAALNADRLSGFFSVLAEELLTLGVTTIITEETRELFITRIEVPTLGVSPIFHNIVFMRQVEMGAELARLITVMKTRDAGHSRVFHELDITDRGIVIGAPYAEGEMTFTGRTHSRRKKVPARPPRRKR